MRNSNYLILTVAVLIAVIGILSIYSANDQIYQRQILWLALALVLFWLFSNFDYRRLWEATYVLYGLVTFLLFLVFALGIVRMGAQRWLRFGWFNFQPSEIAKIAVVIFLAKYFSKKSLDDFSLPAQKFGIMRAIVIPALFILVPAGLIIEQPDLGSAIIVMLIFMIMLFLSGIKLKYLAFICLAGILSWPLFWHVLRDYQKQRLLVFLNPNIDPLGAGYTIIQSKIAIGSGGFFGKGWLSGTQSGLHFLPESHTDFIFAAFAEQWGFFGCAILISLYYILIRTGIGIAVKTGDQFGRLLALGISLMLAVQAGINIAMNLGLAPVVGIPLPLLSYGGSSLLVTFISLGILMNIDKERSVF